MNILFLTLTNIESCKSRNIYTDLLAEFSEHGDRVYIVSPSEKRNREKTHIIEEDAGTVLRVAIGNIKNTNLIRKGLSTIFLESQYIRAVKRYFREVQFDLVLYSTPPITLQKTVAYVKKRDGAESYLLLKDIFPQNAVDIGLISKTGPKGIIYRYFRGKEKKLYRDSDYIGCMSPSNADYLCKHNPYIKPEKVEICPNSIRPAAAKTYDKKSIKRFYGIPENCITFVYGGNLGLPQGVDFILRCLEANADMPDRYFVICGGGTEYSKLAGFLERNKFTNMRLMGRLPSKEYDKLLSACDVGLIFLDKRFTIPNFPSRILSYMENSLPVLAATDLNTDIGEVITENNFGFWCASDDENVFKSLVDEICNKSEDLALLGKNARTCLENCYTANTAYKTIMKHFLKI